MASAVALPATAMALSGGTTASTGDGSSTAAYTASATQARSRGLAVVGLTADHRLVRFNAGSADRIQRKAKIYGLQEDRWLVGIDYRVQDGKLYGVGDLGGVYTIDTGSRFGRATKVSQLTVPLAGTNFGVDFNPAANRLRVISDTGQNLRHNIDDPAGAPAAGTTATDGTLAYPGVPPAPPTTATQVTAAAYTNNDLDPNTATTLFDIDTMLDQVVIQSPANAGTLAATGKLTVDAGRRAGFDIYMTRSGNRGLAVLEVGGRARLYDVALLSGEANRLGSFPSGLNVVDIAIPLGNR